MGKNDYSRTSGWSQVRFQRKRVRLRRIACVQNLFNVRGRIGDESLLQRKDFPEVRNPDLYAGPFGIPRGPDFGEMRQIPLGLNRAE